MSVNMGKAVGYLDLDTTQFKAGFASALSDLKTFQSATATSKDKLAAFGSAATSVGKSMTKKLTVPILGFGAAAASVTARFESSMSEVEAISGATGDELKRLGDKAKEMGAKTKFSASESAQAFKYMALAGWETEEMLDGIEGIMNLAAAAGEDLASVSDIVTDSLTAFGMEAKDAGHFADVLAKTMASSNTDVAGLGEAFKYVAPVAGAFGYTVEDVSTALGLMANAGIKNSQMGTSLRQALVQLTNPSEAAANYMEKFGISLFDAQGNAKPLMEVMTDLRGTFSMTAVDVEKAAEAAEAGDAAWADYAASLNLPVNEQEKLTALTQMFGARAMPAMLAIIQAGEGDFNDLANAIANADGTAQSMAETMLDNFSGSVTIAKSALEGLGIRLGEVFLPALKKIVDKFTEFIQKLTSMDDKTLKFVVTLGGILAAIGPILLIFGGLATKLVSIISLFDKLKMAGGIFGKLSTGSGGLVSKILSLVSAHKLLAVASLGVVGALAGLFVYMKKTGMSSEELKEKITGFFNNLKEKIPTVIESVKQTLSQLISQIPQVLSTMGGFLTDVGPKLVTSIVEGIRTTLPVLLTSILDLVSSLASKIAEMLPELINQGVQMITSLAQGIAQAAPQLLTTLANAVTGATGTLLPKVVEIIKTLGQALITNLPVIMKSVLTIITNVVQALIKAAPQLLEAGLKLIWELAKGLVKALPQILAAIGELVIALLDAIMSILGSMFEAGVEILKSLWEGISSWVGSIVDKVKGVGKRLWQGIKDGLGNLWNTGKEWIMGLVQGWASRQQEMNSKLINFVKSLPQKIKSALGNLFSIGADFIAGLWNGVKSKIGEFLGGLRDKFNEAKNLAKSIFKIGSPSKVMHQYGVWFMEGLENGIDEAYVPLIRSLRHHLNDMIAVYNPLTDYDYKIATSTDQKIVDALDNFSQAGVSEGALAGGNVITQNISIDGAENPSEIAEELARQLKISMRGV